MTDPQQPERSLGEEVAADAPPPADAGPPARRAARVCSSGLAAPSSCAAVAFVVTAFVTPGFLAGPGSPDRMAAQATAALASKGAGEVEKAYCRGPDGKPTTQVPPDALQLIQAATQTGPPHLALDTRAQAPVDLTATAEGGQTQTLPADVMLGVTGGKLVHDRDRAAAVAAGPQAPASRPFERVVAVARELGYRPSLRAQRLRAGTAQTIGLGEQLCDERRSSVSPASSAQRW